MKVAKKKPLGELDFHDFGTGSDPSYHSSHFWVVSGCSACAREGWPVGCFSLALSSSCSSTWATFVDSVETCLSSEECVGVRVRRSVGTMGLFCSEQRMKRKQRAKIAKASYFGRK